MDFKKQIISAAEKPLISLLKDINSESEDWKLSYRFQILYPEVFEEGQAEIPVVAFSNSKEQYVHFASLVFYVHDDGTVDTNSVQILKLTPPLVVESMAELYKKLPHPEERLSAPTTSILDTLSQALKVVNEAITASPIYKMEIRTPQTSAVTAGTKTGSSYGKVPSSTVNHVPVRVERSSSSIGQRDKEEEYRRQIDRELFDNSVTPQWYKEGLPVAYRAEIHKKLRDGYLRKKAENPGLTPKQFWDMQTQRLSETGRLVPRCRVGFAMSVGPDGGCTRKGCSLDSRIIEGDVICKNQTLSVKHP